MQLVQLLEWWNIIFVLPFGLGIMWLLVMAFTGIGAEDFDVDTDVDVDLDMHIDVDAHVDVDHEVHVEAETHIDHSFLLKMLSVFGVGKVPISIIILSFMFSWSCLGFMSNFMMMKNGINPAYFWWVSTIIAFFVSLFLVRLISKGVAKIFPTNENYGYDPTALIGNVATVRYLIDGDDGTSTLYDQNSNFIEIECRVRGNEDPISKGSTVLITRYDKGKKIYFVTPHTKS